MLDGKVSKIQTRDVMAVATAAVKITRECTTPNNLWYLTISWVASTTMLHDVMPFLGCLLGCFDSKVIGEWNRVVTIDTCTHSKDGNGHIVWLPIEMVASSKITIHGQEWNTSTMMERSDQPWPALVP